VGDEKLIPRNTTIPCDADIFTAQNNQTMVEIHVLQGEREMAVDNKSLGRFKLLGLLQHHEVSLKFRWRCCANGILLVTALDRTTGRESITIQALPL